jgi:hypothetical protein
LKNNDFHGEAIPRAGTELVRLDDSSGPKVLTPSFAGQRRWRNARLDGCAHLASFLEGERQWLPTREI